MKTWSEVGIDLKGRRAGKYKTKCPQCSGGTKRTDLSVNIDEKVWKCHRPSCNWTGTLMEREDYGTMKKEYTTPEFNNTALSDKTLEWFLGRGISKATIIRMQVTETLRYVPQAQKERNCICFNYFRGGKLVNTKFRDAAKNFFMVSGAELIFYGLDLIEGKDWCVITEGEIDQLSMYEAGNYPAVSVPNGASKGSARLEYLDNCIDHFEDKTKIILATDNDEPGQALCEELARRLGKEKCWKVKYPDGCKDANEVLIKHGAEALKACIESAEQFPLEGIFEVKDFESAIDEIYNYGYPKGCRVGHERFDELLTFRGGELTTITGIPNSGKSEFMDEIYIRLAAIHNWPFGILSPENQPEALHFGKLASKYVGEPFDGPNRMNHAKLSAAKDFIQNHFYFVRTDEGELTIELVLSVAESLVKRKGIKAFVVDPWNRIEHNVPKGQSETQYINLVLTKIVRFCKKYDVHFFLVAHPTKIRKDKSTGKYEVATMYDIAGSAHFYNKTDNGISVYRDFSNNAVTVYVQKVRFKFIGKIGYSDFDYHYSTGRYKELAAQSFDSFLPASKQTDLPLPEREKSIYKMPEPVYVPEVNELYVGGEPNF